MKWSVTIGIGLISFSGFSQENVFGLFKSDASLAMSAYNDKNYAEAIQLFNDVLAKTPGDKRAHLHLARSFYALKEYDKAVESYRRSSSDLAQFGYDDLFALAESFASTQNYLRAGEYYRECLKVKPGDRLLMKKIWQVENIQNLFEDSAHYTLEPISINSNTGELAALPYQNGIAFISNKDQVELIEKKNAMTGASFYKLYRANSSYDTIAGEVYRTFDGVEQLTGLESKWQSGSISFFDNETKAVFATSSSKASAGGTRHLQLVFAEKKNTHWKVSESFPYNSSEYSNTDPTINENGTILYFSSDMKNGFGGKDIYKSEKVNGKWTPPENLGERINTRYDEVFPFLHNSNALYFSSNGLAGLGGLDVFKAVIYPDGIDDPVNIGFPVNSSWDDFAIYIDSLSESGFVSSNRANGGYDDDIYALSMDLQTYPVTVAGTIKLKEHTWSDSSDLKPMPHARLTLVDTYRSASVYEGTTDRDGNFSVVIPYFSKYILRIEGLENDEHLAVMEIPKERKESSDYQIVVVSDLFKGHQKDDPK
ncbi:MAG: tetratricopeptide repeat protein [Cyclobacteriaceae bacterium]|nr:tetratricopeptide repeat protein [Cyclobacteriaceae bacterium]